MSEIFEYPNSVGTWRYNNSPITTNCFENEIGDKELFSAGNWEKVSDMTTQMSNTPMTDSIIETQETSRRYFKSLCLEQREQMQQDIICILDVVDNTDELVDNICDVIVDRFKIILEKLGD